MGVGGVMERSILWPDARGFLPFFPFFLLVFLSFLGFGTGKFQNRQAGQVLMERREVLK